MLRFHAMKHAVCAVNGCPLWYHRSSSHSILQKRGFTAISIHNAIPPERHHWDVWRKVPPSLTYRGTSHFRIEKYFRKPSAFQLWALNRIIIAFVISPHANPVHEALAFTCHARSIAAGRSLPKCSARTMLISVGGFGEDRSLVSATWPGCFVNSSNQQMLVSNYFTALGWSLRSTQQTQAAKCSASSWQPCSMVTYYINADGWSRFRTSGFWGPSFLWSMRKPKGQNIPNVYPDPQLLSPSIMRSSAVLPSPNLFRCTTWGSKIKNSHHNTIER